MFSSSITHLQHFLCSLTVAHTGGYHCLQGETVSLTQPEGYISSDVTDATGCGSPRAPWRIEAAPGQVIRISLIDFSALEREADVTMDYCHPRYAHIVEADLGVNKSVCGTSARQTVVYTSTSNVVEVHMAAAEARMRSKDHRFMIHYACRYHSKQCIIMPLYFTRCFIIGIYLTIRIRVIEACKPCKYEWQFIDSMTERNQ